MSAVARLVGGLGRFWRGLITEPIARGRLRDTGWPPGLRPIVVVGTVAFCLAVLIILAAPLIRAASPLTVSVGAIVLSLPRLMLPTIFWLIILSIALMQTAALHTRRRTTVVLTVVASLVLLFIGALDFGVDAAGGMAVTAGKVVSVLAVIALVVLVIVRRRARFAWWEFPVVLTIMGGAMVVALARSAAQSAPFGIDFGPPTASLVISTIGLLAVPAALAAGVAVAEFAIGAATSAVSAVQRPLVRARDREGQRGDSAPSTLPVVLVVAFLLVAAWRVIELAVGLALGTGSVLDLADLPLSIGVIVVVGAIWWLLARARRGAPATIDEVMSRLDDVGLPVAAALTITLAPVIILLLSAQVLVAWGVDSATLVGIFVVAETLRGSAVFTVVRVVVAVALIALALRAARRGRRGTPELLAAIGVMALLSVLPTLVETPLTWSSEALAVTIALASIVLAIVLALQRRLDARRLALLTVALLLSAAAAWRDVLADPLSALIGASGIALVLFGFVWGFVTDADVTHADSGAYPRASRVLLFLANAVFGVAVLAFGTLARDLAVGIDLDAFAELGDTLLGTALILSAVLAVWAGATARAAPAAESDSADSRPAAPSVSA